VKKVMAAAGIAGPQASPKGLRHAFGVGSLQAGVPINLVKRWLGHSRLSTTEIYTEAIGQEEQAIAARAWKSFGVGAISGVSGQPAADMVQCSRSHAITDMLYEQPTTTRGFDPMLMVETEREDDGRWMAEIALLPGVMTYGVSREEAVAKAEALALRILADRVEHGEPVPELAMLFSAA
jgi:predicted RNase H-like HicB family nuclease